ncbi:MAG: hypothetical protein U0694_08670 [Anaerolineae bacterium]
MSYGIQKLAGEPIAINTFYTDYSVAEESRQNANDLLTMLDEQNTPIYLIYDATAFTFNFNEILHGIAIGTRQSQLFKHPNVIENALVTDKPFLKSAMEGLNNPLFGSVRFHAFASLEAALAYVRGQIATR